MHSMLHRDQKYDYTRHTSSRSVVDFIHSRSHLLMSAPSDSFICRLTAPRIIKILLH